MPQANDTDANVTDANVSPAPEGAEAASKDQFFAEIASVADRMIAAHGREFAMGSFILAARFIAQDKSAGKEQ